MAVESWQQARLIPTSGITGPEEAERRATSALLAVMGSVREFGVAIVKSLGAHAGNLGTFIEVPFMLGEQRVYPDGLLQTTRAGKTWTCLVEVKTGSSVLERPQVESYLDVAREQGFDCVLTVSNQMSPASGVHPVEVDKRKLKRVDLHHLSWAEILTVAVQQRVHRGVSDLDQAWILGELIRYLEHPRSGALDFTDMGSEWVTVRESVNAGTLRAKDKGLPEVVSRWEQLLRFAALRLGRELGADVQVQLSRREQAEPAIRFAAQADSIVIRGVLFGALRIPDAVAPIDIAADLRSGRVTVSTDVDAPREGKAATRVNWLVRQLRDAPDGLRIDAFVANSRSSTSDLLKSVREDPTVLVADPKRELRTFRIAATSPVGAKRGVGRGGFIDSVLAAVDGFYAAVIQELRPWAARAPQLSRRVETAVEAAGIDVTPPPQDLQEPVADELTSTPDELDTPSEMTDAVASEQPLPAPPAPDEPPAPDQPPAADEAVAPGELVSWDGAHERLEHERAHDETPSPITDVENPTESDEVEPPTNSEAGAW